MAVVSSAAPSPRGGEGGAGAVSSTVTKRRTPERRGAVSSTADALAAASALVPSIRLLLRPCPLANRGQPGGPRTVTVATTTPSEWSVSGG